MAGPVVDLSIIIVSYNTKDLTLQTIQSIAETKEDLRLEVIVVDNNSTDRSVQALRRSAVSNLTIIENTTNAGFGAANNQAARRARGKHLLFLNSDTLVHPQALQRLLQAIDANPGYGIVSGALQNPDGSYQPQGGSLPSLLALSAWWLWPLPGTIPGIPAYQDPRVPEESQQIVQRGWVGGTAMMVPRFVWDRLDGFDEQIFMYAEDIELCIKAAHAGYLVGIVPQATITHYGSASSGKQQARIGEIKGLLYLYTKYYSRHQRVLLTMILMIGTVLRYLYFGILKGKQEDRTLYSKVFSLLLGKDML